MPSLAANKIRVLHVVPVLEVGGIEKGLIDAFAFMDRDRFQLDFLVERDIDTPLADTARKMGCNIIPVGPFKHLHSFAPAFIKTARQYNTVHAHTYLFSGLIMVLARVAGVRQRIAHIHSNIPYKPGHLAAFYRGVLKGCIKSCATDIIAVSRIATAVLYGQERDADGALTIQPMGVDFSKFHESFNAGDTLTSLGIKPDEQIVVNVSRFTTAKNHEYIIYVFDHMVKQLGFQGRLLLIGDGGLRASIVDKVEALGLTDAVIFAGTRYDCHNILRALNGVFIFPSLFEGLGLAAVEAQAAGMPILVSEHVPEEARISDTACMMVPLSDGVAAWAAAADARIKAPILDRAEVLREVEQNKINIKNFVRIISDLYLGANNDMVRPNKH
ncbi:MAG: glycosyltransferase [Alphaproteobacteria bacterium]